MYNNKKKLQNKTMGMFKLLLRGIIINEQIKIK